MKSKVLILSFCLLAVGANAKQDFKIEADQSQVTSKFTAGLYTGNAKLHGDSLLVCSDSIEGIKGTKNKPTQFLATGTENTKPEFNYAPINSTQDWYGMADQIEVSDKNLQLVLRGNAHLNQWDGDKLVKSWDAQEIIFDRHTKKVSVKNEGDKVVDTNKSNRCRISSKG
jgi:lipopolysaccharide transport protein LptA